MYRIEKTDFGLNLLFGGSITADEMAAWYRDIETILPTLNDKFYVFVDMRTLIPLRDDAAEHLAAGQRLCLQNGMLRSVVITASPVISMQFKAIAFDTTIATGERYIDATACPDWKKVGMAWILEGIDPMQLPESAGHKL